MKNKLFFLLIIACLLPGCSPAPSDRWNISCGGDFDNKTVQGLSLVNVDASTFTLGQTRQGTMLEGADQPLQVIQSAFRISSQPIDTKFYQMVYPRQKWPKNGMSYDDVNKMLDKYYAMTGIPLVIASESMYQAAIYAGAIEPKSSQQTIVLDSWSYDRDEPSLRTDWLQRKESTMVVRRRPASREPVERYRRSRSNTFYVALRRNDPRTAELEKELDFTEPVEHQYRSKEKLSVVVGGERFTMLPVEGGQMMLGATDEQDRYAETDEREARTATLEDFMLSQTEVTVGQWKAVMGYLPVGNHQSMKEKAVVNVSWYAAMQFVLALREQTGLPFRLPDEDEWEYAARGGKKSRGYVFSGGNNAADVAVCTLKDKRPVSSNVASKKPNELGFYDMSGNAWEWVRGAYRNTDGTNAVLRSGSRLSHSVACRVSNRQAMPPLAQKDSFGFRIAL